MGRKRVPDFQWSGVWWSGVGRSEIMRAFRAPHPENHKHLIFHNATRSMDEGCGVMAVLCQLGWLAGLGWRQAGLGRSNLLSALVYTEI